MKTRFPVRFNAFVFGLLVSALCNRAVAQNTAFTYQGRLNDNGSLATGSFDLRFAIFDGAATSNQIGSTLIQSAVATTNGIFTAVLDFGPGVFSGSSRWLEIGVRTNGGNVFTTLNPRQALLPSPYAIYSSSAATANTANTAVVANSFNGALSGDVGGPQSATVVNSIRGMSTLTVTQAVNAVNAATSVSQPNAIVKRDGAGGFSAGAIQAASVHGNGAGLTNLNGAALLNGSVSAAKIADGAVNAAHLAPGAALANLQASGQSSVPEGGLVLSVADNDAMVNAGYIKLASIEVGEHWKKHADGISPSPRRSHTAVWTGTEMIIWGGDNGATSLADGARYNPALNLWRGVNTVGAPVERHSHTAVWTGSRIIVWGGNRRYVYGNVFARWLNTGGRYNPVANTWSAVTTSNAPAERVYHTAVWTGSEMIIWGGQGASYYSQDPQPVFKNGGRYNPIANSWTAITLTNAPTQRYLHTAVWTGSEMLVWGGDHGAGYVTDGGRYNPAANTWTAMNPAGAPTTRIKPLAVWSGTEMVYWGGYGPTGRLNTGGRYNPAGDSWTAMSTSGAPTGRENHTAVWTGSEMIVWGGYQNSTLNDGGRYDPANNSWSTVSTTGRPVSRHLHTAVWTGNEMIVWGGFNTDDQGTVPGYPELGTYRIGDGGRYNPGTDSWTAVPPAAPSAVRYGHSAVWTGNELIIWGGNDYLNDGRRYNPVSATWAAVSTVGAPAGRSDHTAVWTGTEMIIWGGTRNSTPLDSGGCYNPVANMWATVSTTAAPSPRTKHTAVWTDQGMIIWGGAGGGNFLGDGACYNPNADNWTALNSVGAPMGRRQHTMVLADGEIIVWGGFNGGYLNDGGRYRLADDTWTPISATDAPLARGYHTAVWTGGEMIVWGGVDVNGVRADGGRYYPSTNGWAVVSQTDAPSARWLHTAVWNGSEMIVWGGGVSGVNTVFRNGARYNPTADSWTPMTNVGSPQGRGGHAAFWTGTEMIIWGGGFNDTWSYVPAYPINIYQHQ